MYEISPGVFVSKEELQARADNLNISFEQLLASNPQIKSAEQEVQEETAPNPIRTMSDEEANQHSTYNSNKLVDVDGRTMNQNSVKETVDSGVSALQGGLSTSESLFAAPGLAEVTDDRLTSQETQVLADIVDKETMQKQWLNQPDYNSVLKDYNNRKNKIVNNNDLTTNEKLKQISQLEAPSIFMYEESMDDLFYSATPKKVVRPEFKEKFENNLIAKPPTNKKELDNNWKNATQKTIDQDEYVQDRMLTYMEVLAPELESKKMDIANKYDMLSQESVDAANAEFEKYRDARLQQAMKGDPSIQQHIDDVSQATSNIYSEKLNKLKRGQSDFYSAVDAAYELNKSLPPILKTPLDLAVTGIEATASWRDLLSRTGTNIADWWEGKTDIFKYDPEEITARKNSKIENYPTGLLKSMIDRVEQGKSALGSEDELEYVFQTGPNQGKIMTVETDADGNRIFATQEEFLNKLKTEYDKRLEPARIRKAEREAIKDWAELAFKAEWDLDKMSMRDVVAGTVESLPYMVAGGVGAVAAVAGAPAGVVIGLTAAGTIANTTAFFADEYEKGILEGLKKDGVENPTDQQYVDAVISGKYDNTALNLASAATQSLLERLGTGSIVKGFFKGVGKNSISSGYKTIFGDGIKQYVKSLPKTGVSLGKSSITEGITEVGQQLTSDINTAYGLGEYGDPFKYVNPKVLGQNFVAGTSIGLFTGGGGRAIRGGAAEIRNASRQLAVNFDWSGKTQESALAFRNLESKVKEAYNNGELTEKEYQEEIEAISNIRNAALGTPKNFRKPAKERSIDLLVERQKLQNRIEREDEAFTGEAKTRINEINQELAKINMVETSLQKQSNIADALNTEFIEAANDQEVYDKMVERGWIDKRTTELIEQENLSAEEAVSKAEKELENASKQRGFNFTDENVVMLNKDRIERSGAYFTGAHEILHQILKKTLAQGDESANILAKALDKKLRAIDTSKLSESKRAGLASFYNRLEAYKNDPNISQAKKAEEVLTLFSEAMEYGQIDLDTKLISEAGTAFRRMAQNIAPGSFGQLQFQNDQDVYRFLRDFNKSMKKGKLTKAQRRAAEQGIQISDELIQDLEGTPDVVEQAPLRTADAALGLGFSFAKDETVERMMEQDVNPFIIAEEFRKDMEALASKMYGPNSSQDDVIKSSFSINKESLIDELILDTEKNRGVTSLVKDYIKKKKAGQVGDQTLGEFVMGKKAGMPQKIKDIAARILGIKDVSVEPEKKKDFTVDEELQSLRKDLGVEDGSDKYNALLDKVKRIVKRGKIKSYKEFVTYLENEFRRDLFDDVKDMMGTPASTKYSNFLDQNLEAIYNKAKQRQINKRFPYLKEKDIDPETGQQRRASTEESQAAGKRIKDKYAGNPQFIKKPFDLQDQKTYFLNPQAVGEKGRASSKQNSLAEMVGEIIGFDAAQQVIRDPEIKQELEEFMGEEEVANVVKELADVMNRPENFSFAMDENGNTIDIDIDVQQAQGQIQTLLDVYDEFGYKDYNGNITREMEEALMQADPNVSKIVINMFEENPNLFGKDGYQNIIKASDAITDDFKDIMKKRSLLLYKSGVLQKDVSDEFAKNTMALAKLIDTDVLTFLDPQLNILGFKYGILDPAKLKKKTGAPGEYFTEYTKTKQFSVDDKKQLAELGLEPKDIIAMNKDGRVLKKILNDVWSQETVEGKLKALQRYQDKIEKANVANIKAFKYIANKMQSAIKDGKITKNFAYQLLQAQTNIVLGFRALSGFEYIYLTEGNQVLPANRFSGQKALKVEDVGTDEWNNYMEKLGNTAEYNDRLNVHRKALQDTDLSGNELEYKAAVKAYIDLIPKGEHLGPNANTMAEIFINISNNTLTEAKLDEMLADHTQFFGPNFIMDIIDAKGVDLGPKTARTSKEGLGRLTKFLPKKYLDKVYGINGQKGVEYIAKEIEFQKLQKTLYDSISEAKDTDVNFIKEYSGDVLSLSKDMDMDEVLSKAKTIDEALRLARKKEKPVKKIRVFDFDDTVARSSSLVIANRGDETMELNAEEFAKDGASLLSQGWEFDFSDFNIVRDGKKGPFFNLAKKISDARGNEDLYILTARAPESQNAIYEFLKESGLPFRRENIVGLGNSTPEAKANWIIDKAAEGYNDFYFADDAYKNVQAVQDALDVIDVKSKVQQANFSFAKDVDADFNKIIEQKSGIAADKVYESAKAKIAGSKKDKFQFFIPYSAEDFQGLIYALLSKGELGNQQLAWFKKNLFDPYARAMSNLSTARLNLMNDFKKLKQDLDVPKKLRDEAVDGLSNEQAVRVYVWNNLGYDVPGLSQSDQKELYDIVATDPQLREFGDKLIKISKGAYVKPDNNWLVGTITTDLLQGLDTIKREELLQDWQENVDLIFSEKNLNKLEAIKGSKYREALENILSRMKSGKNRSTQGSRLSNRILNYINGSNAAIMFFNTRSAILQTISSINFLNWSDNNPYQAGKAFANQPQYWKDFMTLMNSDFLKDRRNGQTIDISSSEIADQAKTSRNKGKAALRYILEKGYLPTQFADSFAIAFGGATFYRNRINTYLKEGLSQAEAEAKAMQDFRETAEESQQSSRPDKISQQQASDYGRLILMFANTPMQYARLQKRAIQDLIAGRGDAKTNISKFIYYSFVQNIIFNSLQQAMFALGFGDEEEEKEEERLENTINGMLDSTLRGLGIAGSTVAVGKNFLLNIYERSQRSRPEYVDSVWEILRISPPIYSKVSKLKQAAYFFDSKKRRDEIFEKGFSLDNPAYEAFAKVVSATLNVPLDRLFAKYDNISTALEEDTDWWQSLAMLGGWPSWDIKPEVKSKSKKKKQKESNRTINTNEIKTPKNKQGTRRTTFSRRPTINRTSKAGRPRKGV